MKADIFNRNDIELLLENFYNTLLADERINYIFTDVAKLDIKAHIPVIADFWETVLLHKNVYHNNTMKIHMELSEKVTITKNHFEVWLAHFNRTVDELFEGKIAEMAKQRAQSVATVMQIKMLEKNKT